ncbi:MAG: trigger factor [Nitrospiraceae bacterium]|nr:MAG: trigger factor [Nitrospiraceae bacterium]
MKLDVTELGPVKRAVRIEVPAEDVSKRFQDVYAELRNQVHIPGFRPGKAPQALLEKRYAKTVEDDVVRQLIPEYYSKAMKETGFKPVSVDLPPLERIKIKNGTPLVFTTTVEIKPVFELREYKGSTLKQDKREITEEELDKAMQVLRHQHAQIETVPEDRAIAAEDIVQVAIERVEGANAPGGFKPETHLIRAGDKTPIYGAVLDDAILGKKKGAAFETGGPALTVWGTVQALKHKVLPDLDDEFAKDLGEYKTLAELRDKVKTQLERSLKQDIEETYKDLLMKRLVEIHHFDVPESLVQRELDAMIHSEKSRQQRLRQLASHGEGGGESPPAFDARKFREESLPTAQQRVKLGLILEAIAEKEGIAVVEADMIEECRQMARAMQVDVAEVVKMLKSNGEDAIEDLRARILAEKALQFVYEKAIIQV